MNRVKRLQQYFEDYRLTEAVDTTPPQSVRKAALRGLALRKKYGRGGLGTQAAGKQGIGSGVARANSLAKGQKQNPKTISRMVAFFARHEKNKNTPPEKGNGKIAWLLWGGDAGKAWANKVKNQLDNAKEAKQRRALLAARALEHLAGKHNQKSHANKYGSTDDIKANVKRLGKDKQALKRMAGRARGDKDFQAGVKADAAKKRNSRNPISKLTPEDKKKVEKLSKRVEKMKTKEDSLMKEFIKNPSKELNDKIMGLSKRIKRDEGEIDRINYSAALPNLRTTK